MKPSRSESSSRVLQRLEAFSPVAGALSVVTGLLVLTGWVLDVPALESFVPGLPAMKVNAALAFIFAGTSLYLSQQGEPEPSAKPLRQYAASVCALAVAVLGLLTLAEYVLERDFGIDQLLLKDPRGSSGPFPPGRMPPVSCLNFIAAGTGLLLLRVESKKGHRPTEFLALFLALGGMLGFLNVTYQPGFSYTGMAPNGILTFWVLACGLLGVRPRGHLVRLLSGPGAGAAIARRLLPASVLVPLLLGWLRVESQRRGLFGAEFGTSIMVVANVAALAAVVFFAARSLDRTDTERRMAQEELAKSAGFRDRAGLLDLTYDSVILRDMEGTILFWNRGAEGTYGWARDEAIGQNSHSLLRTRFPKPFAEIQEELLREGHWQGELTHTRRDGGGRVVASRWTVECDDHGRPVRTLEINNDLTDRRRAEAELRRFFSLSLDMLCIVGFDGYFKRLNSAWETTLGFTTEELRSEPLMSFVHPDDRQTTAGLFERLAAGIGTTGFENRYRTKDGSYRWLLWNAAPYLGQRLMYAAARDITERKQAEERLAHLLRQAEAAETRFRRLLEAAPDAILISDSSGRITLVNRKVEELFGYPREELHGIMEEILIPERLRREHVENRLRYFSHPEVRAMHGAPDLVGRRKDGSEFPLEISLSPMQSEDGLLVIAVVRDITERKRAQEQLEELRRQNELILHSAGEGICRMGLDARCTFVNLTGARMIGWEVEELIGRNLHQMIHHTKPDGSSYPEENCPASQTLKDGKPRSLSEVFWRKDGSTFPVEYTCTPIYENDHIAGVVETFRDITERRSVERMKDEFISLVGHEMRTPLTSIRGALGLIATGHLGELPPKSQRMLEVAVTNTDRLVRLINEVLDLERMESGRVSLAKQTCDAADLMAQAAEVMRPLAERAGVLLSPSREPVWVEADPDSILQTLTNLLSNAIKFSPPGTRVELTAQPQGREVLFQVSDQGRGIPADKIETVFERFRQVDASDSRQKGGTGLGLCICRSIVERHGGRIWAESQVGVGSTFSFTLSAGQTPPSKAGATQKGERSLVLVCDDDPVDRDAARHMLQRCGYRVAEVASGAEAIEQAAVHRPSAIVLDLMMPGMGGLETMTALKENEATKDIPIILSSWLSPEESRVPPAQVTAWLRKPLGEELLVEVLRMVHPDNGKSIVD